MRVQLDHAIARQHLLDPDHARPGLPGRRDRLLHLGGDLGRVRRARAEHDPDLRIEVAERADEVHDPLLSRDAADEEEVRPRPIDAVALERRRCRDRPVLLGVDAVADDVDPLGSDGEMAEHVRPGPLRDGDHRIGHLERGALDPARHVISAAELLALPGSQRLE